MISINIGDYINGRIVEKIEKQGNMTYYLITYFCGKVNKPQSIKLEGKDIQTIVKKEDFNKMQRMGGTQ